MNREINEQKIETEALLFSLDSSKVHLLASLFQQSSLNATRPDPTQLATANIYSRVYLQKSRKNRPEVTFHQIVKCA